jgi:hypothetical protein
VNAILSGARLSEANLVGADLRWAQMDRVSLDRTYLQRADLREVTNLDPEELKKAFIDKDPKLSTVCDAMPKIEAPDLGNSRQAEPVNACDRPVKVSNTPDPY